MGYAALQLIPEVHSLHIFRPEDFVVTEVNSKGEFVVLDGYEVPPLPPLSEIPVSGKRRRLFEPESSRPDPSSVPPLQDLVTPQQYHALTQLSQSYKSSLVADPDHRVDLGRSAPPPPPSPLPAPFHLILQVS